VRLLLIISLFLLPAVLPAAEHAPKCDAVKSSDHWSFASFFMTDSAVNYLSQRLGRTFIENECVSKFMHVVMALIVFALALTLTFLAVRRLRRKEDPLLPDEKFSPLSLFDMLFSALIKLMSGVMGEEKARYFMPLIGTLAVFILFSNLLGMIPGFLPPTDNLNTTFALGATVFVATHYYGVKTHGIGYFKHFLGPIIKWYALPLMLIMFLIEMISHLVRPCSLAIRLMGNIFGDHTVLGIFLGFAIPFIPLPIMALGLLVAVVQTLVFCLLSTTYIAMAVEEGHE